ncbi:transposase [Sporosarcina sp. resist]|nr:transposase [Sporosarcina sp. resist]
MARISVLLTGWPHNNRSERAIKPFVIGRKNCFSLNRRKTQKQSPIVSWKLPKKIT